MRTSPSALAMSPYRGEDHSPQMREPVTVLNESVFAVIVAAVVALAFGRVCGLHAAIRALRFASTGEGEANHNTNIKAELCLNP